MAGDQKTMTCTTRADDHGVVGVVENFIATNPQMSIWYYRCINLISWWLDGFFPPL